MIASQAGAPAADDAAGRGVFTRAYLVVVVPLALLFVPLLLHRSADAAGFSGRYRAFLAVAAMAVALVPLAVAAVCRRLRSLAPALSVVVALAALVVGCAVVEVVLTARLRATDAFSAYAEWGHKRSLLFAFEATPNHRWVNAGATYTTDAHGFRTHVRGPWEDATGRRIFALGESAVFGYGLNDDQTWAHLLEGALRERFAQPGLNVVNAGNNGHTSLQTLFRFYTRVLPHHPTDVVLYLGPNDLYGTGPDRLLISEDILFSGSVAQFWAAETRGQNLYARSLLFYVVQQRVPPLARAMRRDAPPASEPPFTPETPADYQRLLDTIGGGYVENIRTICLIAKAKGITPVLATFIDAMEGRPPVILRHNNALLRALAEEQHVPLIDVAGAFESVPDKTSYFFADRYHPNAKGAAFIASVIAARWPAP